MGSTDSDRSISSGISIPQWMKSKIGDRYDIEETFSPPTHDDTFFYIRYPKSKSTQQSEDNSYRPISEVLEEKKSSKEQDFSKHTEPCKEFLTKTKMTSEGLNSVTYSVSQSNSKINKSQGTDDGYTGEGAACGKSVVQVAHQMIAGNKLTWIGAEPDIPARERRRRNSKSLPASPLSTPDASPKPPRRNQVEPQNRYFTGVFGVPAQYPGSWILSGVLGHRDIAAQQNVVHETLTEEEVSTDDQKAEIRRNKSLSSLARMVSDGSKDDDQMSSDGETSPGYLKKETTFRAKPSELREMNFWSPTSM